MTTGSSSAAFDISMADSEAFEDLGKDSDYLEDLARILENLGGLDTLVQELIQNADDARASTMSFDIGEDALIVDNDATFSDCGQQREGTCPWKEEGRRPCDLHAFRRLSGASKRGEIGTTGAFGIGFTAVYQVTDLPELISAGQHIVLDETLEPKKRARRCRREDCPRDHSRGGTRFMLPWAREPGTRLRSALRVDPVTDETAAELAATLEITVPGAMLFLRHLTRVEVYVEDQLLRRFERQCDQQRVRITGGSEAREYLILRAEFGAAVDDLRQTHADLVGGRETRTEVAVPIHGSERGLLYAGLPTHDATGFPFHISADFFPADDRRSLRWNSPPHATWNAAAIQAGAPALAERVVPWRDAVGAVRLWTSLRSAAVAASQAGDDLRGEALGKLWLGLRDQLRTAPIVWSQAGEWITPPEARLTIAGTPSLAEDVLSHLGVNLVDRPIAVNISTLKAEIPVPALGFDETLAALEQVVPVGSICAPEELVDPFDDSAVREALLNTLALLAQESGRAAFERVGTLTLAPEVTGQIGPLQCLYRCSESHRALFRRLDPALLFLDDKRMRDIDPELAALAPDWDCEAAVEHLAELCESERLDVPTKLLDEVILWLAEHAATIGGNQALKTAVRALPIWPTTRGRGVLEGVALPSGRLDKLPLANTVDLARIPHTRVFLSQTLGIKSLDLTTYCCEVLPKSFGSDVGAAERQDVVETLGRIKPEVIGDDRVRDALRPLALVECCDGSWRHVNEAYRSSPELNELLGPDYPQAVFDSRKPSVARDVLEWLGIDDKPRAADLIERIEQLTAAPPNKQSRTTAHRLLDHFAHRADEWDETFIAALKERAWMTAGQHPGWHRPPTLYQRVNRGWFATQAMFHDAPNERPKTDFLRTLGLDTVPPAGLVTRHLLVLANRNEPAPWAMYEHLDAHTSEADLQLLEGQPCILVNEEGSYVRPDHVFQDRQPFKGRRAVLPTRLRGYTRLLDALEIAAEPDAFDAKNVLEELAAEPDLAPDDESVVHACWRMLQDALGSDEEIPDLEALGSLAVAIDSEGRPRPPSSLLFNDAPSLADRLADRVAARLITRQEDTWRALQAAGVRNLSDAVAAEIVGTTGKILDPSFLENRLRERAGLFARVVEASIPGQGADVRAHARSLHVDASPELRVRYHLDDDSGKVYSVRALYDRASDMLYVAVSNGLVAWTECAKELARAMAPFLLPHIIAPSFRAVLEPATAREAEDELNELDIPRLEDEAQVDWEQAGEDWSQQPDEAEPDLDAFELGFEPELGPQDASDCDEADDTGVRQEPEPDEPIDESQPDGSGEPPEHSDSSDADSQSIDNGASPPAPSAKGKREPRTPGSPLSNGYLETFLVVSPKGSGSDIASKDELENMAIDRAGTNAVIHYEESCGRQPERKSHSWPGYDIESHSDEKLERIIEVKSIDGPWDAARPRLSKEQFKAANEHGDLYWLYVVEHARTNPTVWRVQDPGRRVHGFAYIPDWKRLSEQDGDTASTPDRQQERSS